MKKLITLCITLLFAFSINAQNYSLHFDGSNDYVDCGSNSSLDIGSTFTLEFWINPSTLTSNDGIISKRDDYSSGNYDWYLFYGSTGLQFNYNTGSSAAEIFSSYPNPSIDEWTHIAIVRDGSSWTLYVNGVSYATATNSATFLTGDKVRLGVLDGSALTSYLFDGYLDEVRFWSVARSIGDIRANMFEEIDNTTSGLEAYYKMSNGSGTTLTDNDNSATNTGTISGATWATSGAFSGSRNCLDFDGTNDFVNCGNDASLNLGTAYTMEL